MATLPPQSNSTPSILVQTNTNVQTGKMMSKKEQISGIDPKYHGVPQRDLEAAQAGDVDAMVEVGGYYMDANDNIAAIQWLALAAHRGHSEGQVAYGSMYMTGRGVEMSTELATMWFQKSIKQSKLRNSDGSPRSDERTEKYLVKWVQRAAGAESTIAVPPGHVPVFSITQEAAQCQGSVESKGTCGGGTWISPEGIVPEGIIADGLIIVEEPLPPPPKPKERTWEIPVASLEYIRSGSHSVSTSLPHGLWYATLAMLYGGMWPFILFFHAAGIIMQAVCVLKIQDDIPDESGITPPDVRRRQHRSDATKKINAKRR